MLIYDVDIKEYVESIKTKYPFEIKPIFVHDHVKSGHTMYHNFIYTKYKVADRYRDDYGSFLHLDCDVLVLDNFDKWFELAARTDVIFCAAFPHVPVYIDDYKRFDKDPSKYADVDWIHCMTPLANFPVFYNSRNHACVMKRIWDMQPNEQTCSDSMRNHEMYFFNKAMYEMGRIERTQTLPGNQWVTDNFVGRTSLSPGEIAGKKALIDETGNRIQVLHQKFWKEGVSEAEISRSGNNPLTINSIQQIKELYKFFGKDK